MCCCCANCVAVVVLWTRSSGPCSTKSEIDGVSCVTVADTVQRPSDMVFCAQLIWGFVFLSHGKPRIIGVWPISATRSCVRASWSVIRMRGRQKQEMVPDLFLVSSTLQIVIGVVRGRLSSWCCLMIEGWMKFPSAPESMRASVSTILLRQHN